MKNALRPLVISGILILVLLGFLLDRKTDTGITDTLVMYCAAGIKAPVEEIAKAYEAEYGVQIQLEYGG